VVIERGARGWDGNSIVRVALRTRRRRKGPRKRQAGRGGRAQPAALAAIHGRASAANNALHVLVDDIAARRPSCALFRMTGTWHPRGADPESRRARHRRVTLRRHTT
jgi:hypothetical protein